MSLPDLRKELREIRKTAVRPISKMKKHEVVLELEGHKKPAKKVEVESDSESDYETPVVVKKAPAPKLEKPKVEKPKMEKPKVEKPKMEKPKMEKPKMEKPKVEKPKAEKVEAKPSIKGAPRKKKGE